MDVVGFLLAEHIGQDEHAGAQRRHFVLIGDHAFERAAGPLIRQSLPNDRHRLSPLSPPLLPLRTLATGCKEFACPSSS